MTNIVRDGFIEKFPASSLFIVKSFSSFAPFLPLFSAFYVIFNYSNEVITNTTWKYNPLRDLAKENWELLIPLQKNWFSLFSTL